AREPPERGQQKSVALKARLGRAPSGRSASCRANSSIRRQPSLAGSGQAPRGQSAESSLPRPDCTWTSCEDESAACCSIQGDSQQGPVANRRNYDGPSDAGSESLRSSRLCGLFGSAARSIPCLASQRTVRSMTDNDTSTLIWPCGTRQIFGRCQACQRCS